MSDPLHAPGPEAGHGHSRSEDDYVPSRIIVLVGVGALVVFFLGSLAASAYLRVKQGEHPPLALPPETGQNKIGMVEQQIFELADRGERERAGKLRRLSSYGWVDRRAGLVHLPIDRAMDLVVRGVRPPATPPTGAPASGGAPIGGQP
jgi:hypothetical protein